MGNNSYRLQWPYSNPNYTMQIEFYNGTDVVQRGFIKVGGVAYEGPSNWATGAHNNFIQGLYDS
jgi:hypothetical protein